MQRSCPAPGRLYDRTRDKPRLSRHPHQPLPEAGGFADYMLSDTSGAVVDFKVVFGPQVSDHCPLILET